MKGIHLIAHHAVTHIFCAFCIFTRIFLFCVLVVFTRRYLEMDEDFETVDYVNDQSDNGFSVPLGENDDPASDDDEDHDGEMEPRLRTESESSNLSAMSTGSKFSMLSNVSSLVAGGVFDDGTDEAEERYDILSKVM